MKYKTLRVNLIVLVLCWCTCSIGYYVLAYVLKYLNGSIFSLGYASAAGEVFGKLSTIPILKYLSLRRVFLLSFGMSTISLALMILCADSDLLTPVLLLVNRFFFSQAYVLSYLSIVLLYPTVLAASAGGICVMVSKCVTIIAPMIAEVRSPLNLLIVLCVSLAAAIGSQFLNDENESIDGE